MNYIPDFPIVGADRIINFVQDRNCPYWVVYDSDKPAAASSQGRKTIADNLSKDDETVENGVRRLRSFLSDYQETGFVGYLWCKEKAGSTSGGYYTGIKLTSITPQIAAIGNIQQQVDVQAEIAKAIEYYELKRKLQDLENENKELKILANSETAIDRIIARLEPYSDSIIKGVLTPAQPTPVASVAGAKVLASSENIQNIDEATNITMQSLQILADGDDTIHLKLQKLAEMKQNNPAMYQTALTFLI